MFDYSDDRLDQLAQDVLTHARKLGATQAVAEISEGHGLGVNVRRGQIETIEQNRDKGVGVTVYVGTRRGHASTSDFSTPALHQTVQAAYDIARHTAEDPAAGLPEAELLALDPIDLDLFHPWDLTADSAIALARRMEGAAFAVSPEIRNSEGASVNASHGHFRMANSLGFRGGYPYSRHSMGVSPIAGQGDRMQRDDWYSSACMAAKLADPEAIGDYAARRALARLGSRRMKTRKVPVLFEAPLACGLLGHFVQAVSGAALYRRSTFLVDSLGTDVFGADIDIVEDPHVPAEQGSAAFDSEGVRTHRRAVVKGGRLEGYFLSTYSARKLGMQTTGNAGGSHNLQLFSRKGRSGDDLPAMIRRMGTGLLVTDLMGQGVNYVTGDYSRGAGGYWVERGEIRYPVEEITIAGNLRDMFRSIVAVGADVIQRGSKRSGSVLIESMAIAGA